jgi:hypothetical protein
MIEAKDNWSQGLLGVLGVQSLDPDPPINASESSIIRSPPPIYKLLLLKRRLHTGEILVRKEDADRQHAGLQEQKAHRNAQIQAIDEKLRGVAAAQQLQKRRDEKTQERNNVASKRQSANTTLARWVGTKGILVVARKLAKEPLDFIDERSLRGRIPSPYNEDFVKELLSAERCICGRDIHPGTDEWRSVAELLKGASNGGGKCQ